MNLEKNHPSTWAVRGDIKVACISGAIAKWVAIDLGNEEQAVMTSDVDCAPVMAAAFSINRSLGECT